jgi:hypothetical protein
MKLVFTIEEVATSLQLTVAEFETKRPRLEELGFPRPLQGLENRWSIMDIVNWVGQSGAEPPLEDCRQLMHPRSMLS